MFFLRSFVRAMFASKAKTYQGIRRRKKEVRRRKRRWSQPALRRRPVSICMRTGLLKISGWARIASSLDDEDSIEVVRVHAIGSIDYIDFIAINAEGTS